MLHTSKLFCVLASLDVVHVQCPGQLAALNVRVATCNVVKRLYLQPVSTRPHGQDRTLNFKYLPFSHPSHLHCDFVLNQQRARAGKHSAVPCQPPSSPTLGFPSGHRLLHQPQGRWSSPTMLWTLRRGKRGRAAACMRSRFKSTVAEGLVPGRCCKCDDLNGAGIALLILGILVSAPHRSCGRGTC